MHISRCGPVCHFMFYTIGLMVEMIHSEFAKQNYRERSSLMNDIDILFY